MCQIINLAEHRQKKQEQEDKAKLVADCRRSESKEDFNYQFLTLLDMFFQEYDPSVYWRFDIFLERIINQK